MNTCVSVMPTHLTQDRAKHQAARRWVSAVNNWGQLGRWDFHVCKDPQMLGRELEWLKKQDMER
jgi:type III restriction enzyme